MPPAKASGAAPAPYVLAWLPRERARAVVRAAFPRRRARVVIVRSEEECAVQLRTTLVDAAIVDVGAATEATWRVATLARDFPSVAFFGLAPLRAGEGSALGQCAALGFADLLVEGVDDEAMRELVLRSAFSARFTRALNEPPPALRLDSPLQRAAWQEVVLHGGRPVRTSALAGRLEVTREHLSRTFSAGDAPNLKRVIDLVRLIAAAELAKNPGHDLRDVAQVLEFASSSHLASTAQRIVGTRTAALARLRGVDLVERFVHGHTRSRG
jgi:AraC-like DNA-binding protein